MDFYSTNNEYIYIWTYRLPIMIRTWLHFYQLINITQIRIQMPYLLSKNRGKNTDFQNLFSAIRRNRN